MENLFDIKKDASDPDYVSFDEIENAFKTPTQRQADYEPKPDPVPGTDDLGRLADPDGSAREPVELEADPVINREHAQRTGERIARLIDSGIDFTLSNFVARNGESYHAEERDLKDIAEAWGEISEERQWNIGPEWTLIILYLMVYGPLVKQAVADRRMAAIEAEQRSMNARLATLENQQQANNGNSDPERNTNPDPAPNPFNYRPSEG